MPGVKTLVLATDVSLGEALVESKCMSGIHKRLPLQKLWPQAVWHHFLFRHCTAAWLLPFQLTHGKCIY